MLDQTSLMARVLHGAGAKQNDVISVVSENRFEYPAVTFGAFYLGVIVAPANVTYTEREFNKKKLSIHSHHSQVSMVSCNVEIHSKEVEFEVLSFMFLFSMSSKR